jgi:hypothetical protein
VEDGKKIYFKFNWCELSLDVFALNFFGNVILIVTVASEYLKLVTFSKDILGTFILWFCPCNLMTIYLHTVMAYILIIISSSCLSFLQLCIQYSWRLICRRYYGYYCHVSGVRWLIIMGSGLDDGIYWHFFTITTNYNSSQLMTV